MGMADSRSARSTPQSYRLQPTQSSPISTRSVGEHCTILQAGRREELLMGPRVGQNKWAVTARAKRKRTNCLPAITNHTADETCSGYPAVYCSASAGSQQSRFLRPSTENQNHGSNNKQVRIAPGITQWSKPQPSSRSPPRCRTA